MFQAFLTFLAENQLYDWYVTGTGAAAAVAVKKSIAIFTYKHSLFSPDMKTKLVEHVPRIKIMHLTYMSYMTSYFGEENKLFHDCLNQGPG